jgi:hypothetical protein
VSAIDVFKSSPSYELLRSVFDFVDAHVVGTAAAEMKPKPIVVWSTPLVSRYVSLSESRGRAMVVLHSRALRDPALGALFEQLRPWRDGTGNTILFKEPLAPYPAVLATVLGSMLPVLEPIYLAAQEKAKAAPPPPPIPAPAPAKKSATKSQAK